MPTPWKWLPSDVPIADPQTQNRIPMPWVLFFQHLLTQAANAIAVGTGSGSGTAGTVAAFDSTGNLTSVPNGTTGQVLTSTGLSTPPAFQTPTAGAGSSWIPLSLGVEQTYDNYLVASGTTQQPPQSLVFVSNGAGEPILVAYP